MARVPRDLLAEWELLTPGPRRVFDRWPVEWEDFADTLGRIRDDLELGRPALMAHVGHLLEVGLIECGPAPWDWEVPQLTYWTRRVAFPRPAA